MRKTQAAVAVCHLIAFAIAASSVSPAQAMPAPVPGDVDMSLGTLEWGAEMDELPAVGNEQMLSALLELAKPLPTARSKAEMCDTLAAAAQVHELPVGFFVRLINQESGFNPEVVSPAGAQGVAQFMPRVAQEWGLKNPFDPHAALIASARFLRSLYEQFGNWGLAAAAYNGGMGRVQKWIDKRGKLPEETRNYVMRITGLSADDWAGSKPPIAKFSIPERAPCQEIAYLADRPTSTPTASAPAPQPVRAQQYLQIAAGPPSKTGSGSVTVVTVKGGTKVATIKVRPARRVAVAKAKVAAPASIVAANAPAKGKRGKASAVKVAAKSPAKSEASAKGSKGNKDRIRLADTRGSRK